MPIPERARRSVAPSLPQNAGTGRPLVLIATQRGVVVGGRSPGAGRRVSGGGRGSCDIGVVGILEPWAPYRAAHHTGADAPPPAKRPMMSWFGGGYLHDGQRGLVLRCPQSPSR